MNAGLKNEKTQIRQELLEKRMAIPQDERKAAEEKMTGIFLRLTSFRFADTILLYSPIRNEPGTERIFEAAKQRGKRIAFPVCHPETSTMEYRYVGDLTELVSGTYGTAEPPETAEPYIPAPGRHDICVVPAVCFDRQGYRVGYGKGYYDRFLSSFSGTTVGFVMTPFLFPSLPRGRFDRTVQIIITEKGVITTG